MLTSANSVIEQDNSDALSIGDIPFDDLEAEEENGLGSDKENLPPSRKKGGNPKKIHQLSKKALKGVHRQGELLKRTAQIAPPTAGTTITNTNGDLKSFLTNYYKKETQKNKENCNTIKGRGTKEAISYLNKKPWAKLLTKDEINRIANQKPNPSFDSDKSFSNSDSLQPIVVIKTEQCGRSDATKRIIKQGIISQKPVKNSIEQLNCTLQAKITEQSTQAWRIRKEAFRRKTNDILEKEKQFTIEDERQLTEEEEDTKSELGHEDDLLQGLCFDIGKEKRGKEEKLPDDLLLELYSKKSQGTEIPSEGGEEVSETNEGDNDEQLDDLIEEALKEVEPLNDEITNEGVLLLEKKERQQKSITGFLNGGNNSVAFDLPLFVAQNEGEQKIKRKKRENDQEFKYKNYFLDEEAQLSEGEDDGSKKKRSKLLDSDEVVDEAEIERELRASKFIVENEDEEEEDMAGQALATHAMLQRKADMEAIKKLTDRFNIDSEVEDNLSEDQVAKDEEDHHEHQHDIWAGKILTSDLRYSSHGEQLTEEDEEEEQDFIGEDYKEREDPIEEVDFAHTKSNALDDLLKISSDYTARAKRSKQLVLPTGKSFLPDLLKMRFSNPDKNQ